MPLVKYGAGVTNVSGSTSGNTFFRNRSGAVMRTRTTPTNTRSKAQNKSRSCFTVLTNFYHNTLTESQRASWNTYAANVKVKNKLAELTNLTGQLMFVRSNQSRLTAGMSLVAAAPTIALLGEKDTTVVISGESPPVLSISFDTSQAWVTETDAALLVHVGVPQSKTRNQFNGPWRFASAILGSSAMPPSSPRVVLSPWPISAEQKLFVKTTIIRADGRASNEFRLPPKIYTKMLRLLSTNASPNHTIYLRTLSGGSIKSYNRPLFWRGIHQDPLDNTLWCVIPINDHIINFYLSGTDAVVITESTPNEPIKGFDGCCIDTRDGTLWIPGDKDSVENLNHYERTLDAGGHFPLIETFDTTSYIGVAKDLCFDSSDNTLWLTDTGRGKIVHVCPATGLEISGSFSLVGIGYPVGTYISCIEYDSQTDTFWCGDPAVGCYHMTKTGVLLETITLQSNPANLAGLTLAPLTIEG